jgi:hypothetical protein
VIISWAKYADKWVYGIAEERFEKTCPFGKCA